MASMATRSSRALFTLDWYRALSAEGQLAFLAARSWRVLFWVGCYRRCSCCGRALVWSPRPLTGLRSTRALTAELARGLRTI